MLKHLKTQDIEDVIACAEANNAREKPGFLRIPSDEADQLVEEILKGNPDRDRLVKRIESLTPDALHELEALMWTGRGDADRSFEENLDTARKNKDPGTVYYIAQKAVALPDYLRKGLEKLQTPRAAA